MTRTRVIVAATLVLLASSAGAAPNQEVTMQPDETFPWACEFTTTLASVSGTWTYLQGSSGTCTNLVTGLQVNTGNSKQAIWQLTPGSLDPSKEHVCWVHVIGTDTSGAKFGCDGKVTVRKNKPTS